MTDKPDNAEASAKRWFVYCLTVAAVLWIAGALAGFSILVIHPDYTATLGLFTLAVFLAVIACIFSVLAFTGLIDWRLVRKHQPHDG
jgi:hypothetical protein